MIEAVELTDYIYTGTPAATPRAVGDNETDRLAVVTALDVLPKRPPKSGVRLRGEQDLEWSR